MVNVLSFSLLWKLPVNALSWLLIVFVPSLPLFLLLVLRLVGWTPQWRAVFSYRPCPWRLPHLSTTSFSRYHTELHRKYLVSTRPVHLNELNNKQNHFQIQRWKTTPKLYPVSPDRKLTCIYILNVCRLLLVYCLCLHIFTALIIILHIPSLGTHSTMKW